MLMRHEVHGWHNAIGNEVETMKANGWIESNYEEHAKFVADKLAPQVTESDTIEPQREAVKGKPGRKPKQTLASLGYGNDPTGN